MNIEEVFSQFNVPPQEFGPIPFWFWNDDLEEGELVRQLREFHRAGFGGVLIHPRIGLSHRVGYLSEEYFRLVRLVVDEAARLGMKILLYDEGSYPSGSAKGGVVAENPDYASKAIGLWTRDIEGPFTGFWRPNTGRALLDRHVCTLVGRVDDRGCIEPDSVEIIEPEPRDIFRIEVTGGQWKAMSVWQTYSGGQIRGVHPEEESDHATAPAAGDILNPEAVACFIRLTHERYYEHLQDHFSTTIIGLFTDEPGVFGKGLRRPAGGKPFTTGFIDWLAEHWGEDPRPWLPALWIDYGEETEFFRSRYSAAVQARLHEVFYRAQSQWCHDRGIALTGHPAKSNELSALRYFQLPGQDMVWRYITPGNDSGRVGAHSLAAKVATSAARIAGRERILTEVCGAYGWQLSLDEIKWLYDWHLSRGNNLINPHACFYSIRGRRAWESEPDLGLHNPFWRYMPQINTYTARLSWLMSGAKQVCEVAILGDGNDLPWESARRLSESQVDFLFVDDGALGQACIDRGKLVVGEQAYAVLIVEGDPILGRETRNIIDVFAASGGLVLHYGDELDLVAAIDECTARDLLADPPEADLRSIHFLRDDLDFFLLFNEGEDQLATTLALASSGHIERWDPLTGLKQPIEAIAKEDSLEIDLKLERRESAIIVVDSSRSYEAPSASEIRVEMIPLEVQWEVCDERGNPLKIPVPGDWALHPGLELFSGSIRYCAEIEIPQADEVGLDLGRVGDIAEVFLDTHRVGSCLWAPYRVNLGANIKPGLHQVEVLVTNSAANEFEGLQLPSGLLGPFKLILYNNQG